MTGPRVFAMFVAVMVVIVLSIIISENDGTGAESQQSLWMRHKLWDCLHDLVSPDNDRPPQQWPECPKPNQGPGSIVVATQSHGRLGNQIWEYLSAWAVARHYGLYPAAPNSTTFELAKYFEPLSGATLEILAKACELPHLMHAFRCGPTTGSQETLLMRIESAVPDVVSLVRLPFYIVHTEEVLTQWSDLRRELRFKPELRDAAQDKLRLVRDTIVNGTHEEITTSATKTSSEWIRDALPLEFVGVHVRRTDYLNHVVHNYPGARAADQRFFLNAMQWLRNRLQRPLAFVVVSDDLTWCRKNLNGSDVFIEGNGDQSSPGSDLALLAACNHTIFSYGTFGLSAAMLANGRFTLLYDTQNNTNSKEMEFANYLPGWHILDDEGKEHYKPGRKSFNFTYVKG